MLNACWLLSQFLGCFFFVRCMWGFARVSSWGLLVGICVGVGSSLGFGLFFCVCGILGVPYEYYGF